MKQRLVPLLPLLALFLLASCNDNPEQTSLSLQNDDKSQTEINAPQNSVGSPVGRSASGNTLNSGVISNGARNADIPQDNKETPFIISQVQAWDAQRIRTLSFQQMTQIPPECCQILSSEQLRAFSTEQLLCLRFECLIALSHRNSVASLKDLTRNQLLSLSHRLKNYFHHLNSEDQLRSITADQFEDLHKIDPDFPFTPLMHAYFGHRLEKGASQQAPSVLKYRELFLDINDFSEAEIKAIPENLIQHLWGLPLLSGAQIKAFRKEQLKKLNADQWNLLLPFQIKALISNQGSLFDLLEIIHSKKVVVRDLSRTFLQTLFPKVTEDSVREMTEEMILDLVFNGPQEGQPWMLHFKAVISHWSEFNSQQLQSIPPHLFRLINSENWKSLRPEQIKGLLPRQIGSLNGRQLANLIRSEKHLNAFEPHQIQHISPRAIRHLDKTEALKFFQGKNVSLNLTKEQFRSLPKELQNEIQTTGAQSLVVEKLWLEKLDQSKGEQTEQLSQ